MYNLEEEEDGEGVAVQLLSSERVKHVRCCQIGPFCFECSKHSRSHRPTLERIAECP